MVHHKLAQRLTTKFGHLILGLATALIVGLGVPLLWVWLGSMLQANQPQPSTSVDSSTAATMVVGIVVTYVLVLWVGAWIQSRLAGHADGPGQRGAPRHPWNRSMRDEPYRPGERRLGPVEAAFVCTAVATSAAFVIWYFAAAGSPLPQGP